MFPARQLAEWFVESDSALIQSTPGWNDLADAVHDLAPTAALTTRAFVPLDVWTLLLTNGPLGTDVGMLPSHAARSLGCVGNRAVWADGSHHQYPAVILEVYSVDGEGPLRVRRTIAAANDGGRWVFEQTGEPYGFEHTEYYAARRKADRFPPDLLHEYLRELGVPLDASPGWADSVVATS
jgi:hypothetical protein